MRAPSVLRWWICFGLIGLGGWSSGARVASALDILPHSFSRSRQFVVYARDASLRGAVGSLAEDTKSGLLSALGLRDEWSIPFVIDLRVPEGSAPDLRIPVRWSLGQTGSGLKIELDLVIGEVGRGTRIRDELVRGLLLEIAYRDHDRLPAGQAYTPPPPWLVTGLSAYLENLEDGVSASMFAALLPTTQALSITEFLSRDPATMDSTSRAVYRAYAYNLVCLLVREMKGGRAGIVAFLHNLPDTTYDDARSAGALGRQFPELASPDSLDKWWTIGLARLSASDRYQIFSVRETEEHLQKALTFTMPADAKKKLPAKTYTLADFREFTALKRNRELLEGTRETLMTLSGQANPLYRQIVADYTALVAGLTRGRTGGVEEKLQVLTVQRRDTLKYRDDVADYMNWYEATQAATQSGSFEDYFHTVRQLDAGQRAHRPDAISVYLDGLGTELR